MLCLATVLPFKIHVSDGAISHHLLSTSWTVRPGLPITTEAMMAEAPKNDSAGGMPGGMPGGGVGGMDF